MFKDFFIRDITPVLNHLHEDGIRLRNHPIYSNITTEIEGLLKEKYPKVKCHLFGSRIIGLGNDRSTLNIYVDLRKLFGIFFKLNECHSLSPF